MQRIYSVTVLLGVVLVAGWYAAMHLADSRRWNGALDAEAARAEQLDLLFQAKRDFQVQMAALLAEAAESLTLEETCGRVESLALTQFPEFLDYLMMMEHGETLQEKIAANVLRHLQHAATDSDDARFALALVRFQAEQQALLGHTSERFAVVH